MNPFDIFVNGGRSSNRRRRTENITREYPISLEDLYKGKISKFRVTHKIICPTCKGVGGAEGCERSCPSCNGRGVRVRVIQHGNVIQQMQSPCPSCNGRGRIIDDSKRCKNCHGNKVVSETKTIEVAVERGMKDGLGRDVYPTDRALRLESHGVFATRLQNVAITADRVKHFLAQQPAELRAVPPFRLLSDAEVLDFLWFGPNSVMKRLLRAALAEISDPPAIQLFAALEHALQQPRDTATLAWVRLQMTSGFPVSPIRCSAGRTADVAGAAALPPGRGGPADHVSAHRGVLRGHRVPQRQGRARLPPLLRSALLLRDNVQAARR